MSCLLFLFNEDLNSQHSPLAVGGQVPGDLVLKIQNKTGEYKVSFSELKGTSIIIDFWATWCAPCVAMFPKISSLQQKVGDKIRFLAVTYQNGQEVIPFLHKYNASRSVSLETDMVLEDTTLTRLFPHRYLPHYVWIDGEGIVKAITGFEEVTEANVQALVANRLGNLSLKRDTRIAFDPELPLLVNGNGGNGQNLIYHSVMTTYTPGLPLAYKVSKKDDPQPMKLTVTNFSRLGLYKVAFGEYHWTINNSSVIFDVAEPERLTTQLVGEPYLNWLATNNGFCYELIVPVEHRSKAFELMRKDLDLLFSEYKASVEKRLTPALVLTAIEGYEKLKSSGGEERLQVDQFSFSCRNKPLDVFLKALKMKYLQRHPLPIVNESGIKYPIDMDINANLSNVNELNKALSTFGLAFIEAEREIDMLIIRDRN